MQVHPAGSFHLTYCTNIHPGESWADVEHNLRTYTVPLRSRLAPEQDFGVGLRLSDRAARELLEADRLSRFKDWLGTEGFYVFTLNGFPFGGFHRRVVKDRVYAPDWRSSDRVEYTHRLIEILAALLPDDLEGSISTSPLSYKHWLDLPARAEARLASAEHLALVAYTLHRLHQDTGRLIHLGLEPEPDCLIEDSRETIAFFEDSLLVDGAAKLLSQHGVPASQAEEMLRRHVGVCYDTCHFAVEFEDSDTALAGFRRAGITLSKVQLSAALRVPLGENVPRAELASALEPFAESTYLHQVIARHSDGSLSRYADLPDALPHLPAATAEEWRIHYHVPLFVDRYDVLYSTQSDLASALDVVVREALAAHLEIETYTWDVLPPALKTDVVTSIGREYEWVLERLRVPQQ